MGVYVYKTKPTAIADVTFETLDGKRTRAHVQVYEYAFKCYRYSEDERTRAKVCGPAERAFERLNTQPLNWGITAYEGRVGIGDPVFHTGNAIAAVEIGDGKSIGRIVAVHRGVKLFQPRPVVTHVPVVKPVVAPVAAPRLGDEPCKPAAAMATIDFI